MRRIKIGFISIFAMLLLAFIAVACGPAPVKEEQMPAQVPVKIVETFSSDIEIVGRYEIPVTSANNTRRIGVTIFYDKIRNVTCFLTLNWYSSEASDLECLEGKRDASLR